MDSPISNIETTGVEAAVVENMEIALKRDIWQEMKTNGRILLHDEVETQAGHFELAPVWKVVAEDDLRTPRELYDQVIKEGFQVEYSRIAITRVYWDNLVKSSYADIVFRILGMNKHHYLKRCKSC